MKKFKFFLTSLVFFNVLLWSAVFNLPDQRLHLKFYNVGQGDSILIKTISNYKILIDGGPSDRVLSYLGQDLSFYDRTLDVVVLTHPDNDHLKGLLSVIERYNVKQIWMPQVEKDTETFKKFQEIVKNKNIKVGYPKENDFIDFKDGLKITILNPKKVFSSSKTNSYSIVAWGELKTKGVESFDFLLSGDAGEEVQPYENTGKTLELLKVPHHGSKTGLLDSYLEKLKPELSVISVGKNSYGHPALEILEKLKKLGSQVLRTDEKGSIEVVSDGDSWYTKTER